MSELTPDHRHDMEVLLESSDWSLAPLERKVDALEAFISPLLDAAYAAGQQDRHAVDQPVEDALRRQCDRAEARAAAAAGDGLTLKGVVEVVRRKFAQRGDALGVAAESACSAAMFLVVAKTIGILRKHPPEEVTSLVAYKHWLFIELMDLMEPVAPEMARKWSAEMKDLGAK